ncbi:hypothetical protein L1049_015720 [Liquidambar formosana]|uniref:Disease resistance protein RGA3 n=1 Tax=Liquidambar formosana TaxID=63359 RepID=A0AAP0RYJ3_LIQFO
MAEFIFFVVEEALKGAASVAAQEVILAWGLKEDLTRLSDSWTYIQPLLRVAEQQQGRNNDVVRKWLNKLRDTALDAEDALDEIDYERLRREVELRNGTKKKVRDFFSGSNPIAFRFKMAHKVKKINVLVEQIKHDASFIGLERLIVAGTPQPSRPKALDRESVSFVENDSKVVGRQEEVSEIVDMLIESGNQEVLTVIPIVGMAGLGKTTMAQKVFNDDRLKGHFDAKIWVCVSENFEAKRILRACLESLIQEKAAMESLNAIIQSLQKELEGKKYLLVMDDVWNTDVEKWCSLKAYLLQINTKKGNKIIVTVSQRRSYINHGGAS